MSLQPVSVVRALQHGGELRVSDPGLLPGGAHRAWADPDLDDVGPGKDQSFNHIASHHVASLMQRTKEEDS